MKVLLTSFLLLLQCGLTAATSGTSEANAATGTHRRATPDSRIIGGEGAVKGRYPYMASIHELSNLDHLCGGTLIAPDIILTIGSCGATPGQTVIRIGPHNLNIPAEGSEIFPMLQRVLHPDFDQQSFPTVADFALFKLDGISKNTPVQLNKDPAIPVYGQQTRVIGWGNSAQDFYSREDTLQVSDSSIYTNNAECERILIELMIFRESTTFTDDTMCNMMDPNGGGACFGDDGGPSLVLGATADEDVQIGIFSLTLDCDHASGPTPAGFARVSWAYDFIRTNVCRMSVDPPSSFQCTDSERIQPTDTPTSSPAPTGEQVEILLQFFTDYYPTDIGWRLEDLNGLVLYEKGPYSYTQVNSVVLEVLSVPAEASYVLVLTDAFKDGILWPVAVQVFLGNIVDPNQLLASSEFPCGSIPILASADGVRSNAPIFTLPPQPAAPSASPSVSLAPTGSNLIDVVVYVKLDSRPIETSWILERADGRLMAEGGPYSPFIGDNITQVVSVEANQMYTFTMYDSALLGRGFGSGGICCTFGFGEAYVYLGSQVPSIKTDNALVHNDGRFDRERSDTFVASPDAIFDFTMAPTPSPVSVVSIVIWFDDSPGDVGWSIVANEGFIVDVVPGTYTNELSSQMVQTIVQLEVGETYTIRFVDSAGDGYCCGNGVGNITAYVGPEPLESNILIANTDGFTAFESFKFVFPEYLDEAVPSPVTSSESTVPVSIMIWFDDYPGEVGWRLSRDGTTVMDVPSGTYKFPLISEMMRTIVELQIDETYEIKFFDSGDSGYCCNAGVGSITVYLGTELLESNVLAASSGRKFNIESEQFIIPALPTAMPSTMPSTMPTYMPSIPPTIMSSPTPTTPPTVMSSPTPTTAPTILSSPTTTIMRNIMTSSTPTIVPSVSDDQSSVNLPSSSTCVSARLLVMLFSIVVRSLLIDGIF